MVGLRPRTQRDIPLSEWNFSEMNVIKLNINLFLQFAGDIRVLNIFRSFRGYVGIAF